MRFFFSALVCAFSLTACAPASFAEAPADVGLSFPNVIPSEFSNISSIPRNTHFFLLDHFDIRAPTLQLIPENAPPADPENPNEPVEFDDTPITPDSVLRLAGEAERAPTSFVYDLPLLDKDVLYAAQMPDIGVFSAFSVEADEDLIPPPDVFIDVSSSTTFPTVGAVASGSDAAAMQVSIDALFQETDARNNEDHVNSRILFVLSESVDGGSFENLQALPSVSFIRTIFLSDETNADGTPLNFGFGATASLSVPQERCYRVTPIDIAGNSGNPSDPVCITTGGVSGCTQTTSTDVSLLAVMALLLWGGRRSSIASSFMHRRK